ERRQHPLLRERGVPRHAPPDTRDVPALDLAEPDADAAAEEPVARVLPELLGGLQEVAALRCEVVERIVEPAVELGVVRRPEALGLAVHNLVLAAVEPVVLLGRFVAGELQSLAHVAVVRVRDARAKIAVRDRLVADLHRLRLSLGDLLLLLAHEVAEVALAGEPPE